MVDPNRKINRLTDRDIEFLDECEREFSSRYSEEDVEFMEYCVKPLADAPVLDNSSFSGSSSAYSYQHNRRGQPNQRCGVKRSWRGHNDGGSNRSRWSDRDRGRFYGTHNGYDNRGQNSRREAYQNNRPPMNIPRDYGNFIAASKDE